MGLTRAHEKEDDAGVGMVLEIGGGESLEHDSGGGGGGGGGGASPSPHPARDSAPRGSATALPAGLQAALRHRQQEIEEEEARKQRRRAQRRRRRSQRKSESQASRSFTTDYGTESRPRGESETAEGVTVPLAAPAPAASADENGAAAGGTCVQDLPTRLGYDGLGGCLRWLMVWIVSAAMVVLLFGVAVPVLVTGSGGGDGEREGVGDTGMLETPSDAGSDRAAMATAWAVGAVVVVGVLWSAMYAFVHWPREDEDDDQEDENEEDGGDGGRRGYAQRGTGAAAPVANPLASASVANPLASASVANPLARLH
jgi:hypothetical protein